jgi:hypothetical protein
LNTIQKKTFNKVFTRYCGVTRKTKQGIAVANYLTEKEFHLLSETLMIQNAKWYVFDYSFIEIFENSSDLSSYTFLQYIAQKCQDEDPLFMILLLQGMAFLCKEN